MIKICNRAVIAATICILSSVPLSSWSAPNKPYAEWTDDEKSAVASELKSQATESCASYTQEAQQGVMRAAYEAAACLYYTYYMGTPADYPGRDQMKAMFYDNASKARALNSSAPVISETP
jgi:hypothetical protein